MYYYSMTKAEIETGSVIHYDDHGSIDYIQQFKDGKLHGQSRYYKQHELTQVREYKNNVLHGTVQSFKEGQLNMLDHYQDGMKTGMSYLYKDSYPILTREYKENKKNGIEVTYLDGCMVKIQRYINDVLHGNYYQYYQTGTMLEKGCFKDGMLDGDVVMYDKSMKIIKHVFYKMGVKMS